MSGQQIDILCVILVHTVAHSLSETTVANVIGIGEV
jgi:hypothetical protein